jgi:hypothetical protein
MDAEPTYDFIPKNEKIRHMRSPTFALCLPANRSLSAIRELSHSGNDLRSDPRHGRRVRGPQYVRRDGLALIGSFRCMWRPVKSDVGAISPRGASAEDRVPSLVSLGAATPSDANLLFGSSALIAHRSRQDWLGCARAWQRDTAAALAAVTHLRKARTISRIACAMAELQRAGSRAFQHSTRPPPVVPSSVAP